MPASLPPLESLCMKKLLAWHAQWQLERGGYPLVQRRRALKKKPPLIQHLLALLVRDPGKPQRSPVNWIQRRRAGQFAARVYAHHANVTVRHARALTAKIWNAAPKSVKQNFYLLMVRTPPLQISGASSAPQAAAESVAATAALLTWQTAHGRGDDQVSRGRKLGLRSDELADLLSQRPEIKAEWDAFVTWLKAGVEKTAFDYWSCSMELNDDSSAKNCLHLHAYVCVSWKKFGLGEWHPGEIVLENWRWSGFVPHVTPMCRFGKKKHPRKPCTTGLYYQMAPKIGQIFTASNLVLWKAFERAGGLFRRAWPFLGACPVAAAGLS